ncbi:MAG: bifunctional glutamate N-acetyltransferase/amino-acid acetyltransferase ArgJ [Gemmatimonadales bacterium]|nr:MAG: bifunctional glutamate N-acetyltransferase/amino-acid acetyltransferase ArgJ [Gemmatimonadales bacterium]
MTRFDDRPRFPRGFRCASRNAGLKASGKDLSLFASDTPAAAAALFTRNHFPGAPIQVGRELVRGGLLQAVVVNSKVSNVATGEEGVEHARRMGRAAASELGIAPELVLMSSTGVIGRRLPIEKIEAGLVGMAAELGEDPVVGAEGIMTTDRVPKAFSLRIGDALLTGVGKGAGMIAPNLATMLVYFFTDAEVPAAELDALLREAARDSFQLLSVDTDTSTSDTVAILANGRAGRVDPEALLGGLRALSIRMAEAIARDGEGATKLLRARVSGAASDDEARRIARAIVESPLIKTMAYGADPNVGRILMAVGKCFECHIVPGRVGARLQGIEVVRGGAASPVDEGRLRALLAGDPVEIEVELGVGAGTARAFGCDLTEGYIHENAAYASS